MKKYAYTILLGLSLLVAGGIWGGKKLTKEYKLVEHLEESRLETDASEEEATSLEEETTSSAVETDASEEESTSLEVETDASEEETTDLEVEAEPNTEAVLSADESNSPAFVEADIHYFDDALFIGDSRTVGLSEYGDLGAADVFADTGMSVFKIFETQISVKSEGKLTLEELLSQKSYAKIYIMLGINEMGYPYESTVAKYQKLVDRVRELQPSALLFLQANLHVTKEKSEANPMYSNEKINQLNQAIQEMTDGSTSFYLDVNELFDDDTGSLAPEYTVDNAHVLGKYYAEWARWILTKTIQR
ncbi:MAG: GDSL-type esterase/lipase family protein [bacterium]|nr:GDSL-type esterase/lipase family protein [bacterium]